MLIGETEVVLVEVEDGESVRLADGKEVVGER